MINVAGRIASPQSSLADIIAEEMVIVVSIHFMFKFSSKFFLASREVSLFSRRPPGALLLTFLVEQVWIDGQVLVSRGLEMAESFDGSLAPCG